VLPERPIDVLDERITALEALKEQTDIAVGASAEKKTALADAEQKQGRIATAIVEQKGRIPLTAARGLMKRALKLVSDATLPSVDLTLQEQWTAAEMAAAVKRLSRALYEYGGALTAIAHERTASEASLLEEANALAAGLIAPTKTLDALVTAAETAQRDATALRASTATEVAHLSEALLRKLQLIADIEALEKRFARLRDIALDLRQDAIVDFLQAQALAGLAADGSVRLRELSAERYELRYRDDEFYVADTWHGAEQRSVKTLSGGETFLASLALALSLSGQVKALSADGRSRLDSLFLDEGFSSLDPGAVELVVEGLERLGSDGRMVGVITHLRAVADQFPRLEVEKLPTGSRVSLVM
jgi:exonuclease SbcC